MTADFSAAAPPANDWTDVVAHADGTTSRYDEEFVSRHDELVGQDVPHVVAVFGYQESDGSTGWTIGVDHVLSIASAEDARQLADALNAAADELERRS